MNHLFLGFVKITGYPIQAFYFNKKIYYEDKQNQNRKIKGGALIVSNHTSVYDYPLTMYTFFTRSIRTLVAEIMYEKGYFFSRLLKHMGGIKVDRNNYDFSFMTEMVNCLNKQQVGLVYPESRLPVEDEIGKGLIEFKPSYIYMALESGAPIIPIYTNGIYGKEKRRKKDRARVIIGKKIYLDELYDNNKTEKENIDYLNHYVKNKIEELGNLLNSKK